MHGELEGFDGSARRAVALAEAEARELRHDHVGTEHLLLGLLADETPVAGALVDAGVTLTAARRKVGEAVRRNSTPSRLESSVLPRTARATRALGRAVRFANARHRDVGSEHVLLGVLDVEGTAGQVLRGLGVDVERLRTMLDDLAGARPGDDAVDSPQDSEPPGQVVSPCMCPSCGAALDDNLVYRTLTADGPGGPRDVVVYVCAACGRAVGAAT